MAKIMEGFTCSRLLSQLEGKIDPSPVRGILRQMPFYICFKRSTKQLMVVRRRLGYSSQSFSKGFDLIDHSILMQELADLEVYPVLLSWITSFLTYRKQAVRIGSTLSDWLTLKGGVPQGTKLGVILFTVMTNRLLSDWRLRIKYVDDTSVFEIIPRNSPSLLNVVALDIHNFASAHNMRLNPTKCKEMHINFLRNSKCLTNPIIIGGNVINSVDTYKILGVIMHNDLKWNSHVDYITKKACKKLYSLQ